MDLYCPNCGENLGDAQENDKVAYCSECQEYVDNEHAIDTREPEDI